MKAAAFPADVHRSANFAIHGVKFSHLQIKTSKTRLIHSAVSESDFQRSFRMERWSRKALVGIFSKA